MSNPLRRWHRFCTSDNVDAVPVGLRSPVAELIAEWAAPESPSLFAAPAAAGIVVIVGIVEPVATDVRTHHSLL